MEWQYQQSWVEENLGTACNKDRNCFTKSKNVWKMDGDELRKIWKI